MREFRGVLRWTSKAERERVLAEAGAWQEEERAAARERIRGVAAILDQPLYAQHPRTTDVIAVPGGRAPLEAELVGHVFDRPSWTCRVDREPWPCEPAREALLASPSPLSYLLIRMSLYRVDAIRDTGLPVTEICDRFTGWIQ